MKRVLRKRYLDLRNTLSLQSREEMSLSILRRLLDDVSYKESRVILFYVSFGSEVDTLPLIERALKDDKKVLVPVTDKEKGILHLSHLQDLCELKRGTYGIMEPGPEFLRFCPYQEVELAIIPGVVFDDKGYRIGYGGGYYDRLLVHLKEDTYLVALAFEVQFGKKIPKEEHDQKVHCIITEKRTYFPSATYD